MSAVTPAEVFVAACRATSRGCRERWQLAEGVVDDTEAERRFCSLPLLLDPSLRALSLRALEAARGPLVDGDAPLPLSIWVGGATDTYGGQSLAALARRAASRAGGTWDADESSIANLVQLLTERSGVIARKRTGWVVTPTTNSNGHRCNASTTAVHALNLDCDGRGTWDRLLAVLESLGLAYVAYQSGGWSPLSPKWHALLPLAQPYDCGTDETRSQWRRIYLRARVALGAIAELPGEGFDPTTDTVSIPIFITERRRAEDPPREVRWRPGYSLDLAALLAALPAVAEVDASRAPTTTRERSAPRAVAAAVSLADAKLDAIVAALCVPMSQIPSGRRDLYMALPGVLLDRDIAPDDVVAICQAVSERCPGAQDRHREHVHCARTTVARWEAGLPYTRIGTLVERWPTVAAALDDAVPDPFLAAMRGFFLEREQSTPRAAAPPAAEAKERAIGTQPLSPDEAAQKLRAILDEIC